MIAVKLAYDGSGFFGSQIQNDKVTVEGQLRKFFNARILSRTDKGVSALGNVIFVEEDINLRRYSFDRIWLYGKAVSWKKPFEKRYSYFLFKNFDTDMVEEACRLISGKHDFFNFCKKDRTKTVDYIKKIDVKPFIDDHIRLDFTGESFLWEMVRRLANAIMKVGEGKIGIEELKTLLEERTDEKIPPAPSEHLLLANIKGFEFSYDHYILKKVKDYFENLYKNAFLKKNIFEYSLEFLRDIDV